MVVMLLISNIISSDLAKSSSNKAKNETTQILDTKTMQSKTKTLSYLK